MADPRPKVSTQRRPKEQGWYCPECGACYSHPGSGVITCGECGSLGLRGFERRPTRVSCSRPGCIWAGWDDGGVNDDLPRHLRLDHPEVSGGGGHSP